jgi:hypothetical protein
VEKYGRARQVTEDDIIHIMHFACWVTKAADTYSKCVTLIAFPRQQLLRERASVLRYTYIACLISSTFSNILVACSRCISFFRSLRTDRAIYLWNFCFPFIRRALVFVSDDLACINIVGVSPIISQ